MVFVVSVQRVIPPLLVTSTSLGDFGSDGVWLGGTLG